MKHFSKIVLGSVLSVAMVLSAGIASANYKKVSAYEVPTTVQTSSIVENIEVESGYASYVVNKKQVGGAYVPLVNGYYRYNLGEVTIEEGKNLQITGYAGLVTAQGGTTAGITHKNTTYVKEAQDKIANAGILSDVAGNGYLYAVNVGGVNKYSKLTLTDLQGLYTYAGDATVITAWVNEN